MADFEEKTDARKKKEIINSTQKEKNKRSADGCGNTESRDKGDRICLMGKKKCCGAF